MNIIIRVLFFAVYIILAGCVSSSQIPRTNSNLTVLSWNISGDAFVSYPDKFKALLQYAAADIILLDEVSPSTTVAQLQSVLPSRMPDSGQSATNGVWHVSYGISGGRQRGVIASREPLEEVQEFREIVPYPDDDRHTIMQRMPKADQIKYGSTMDAGIAVNGSIILNGSRRLLVVIADLECCGNDPSHWAELKRRIEAKLIRKVIRTILKRTTVDGIILAGDFNLVSTPIPFVLMTGPYNKPHSGLIAAELYHRDGKSTWTWDGRNTPFPSRALDYQLYSPSSLGVSQGTILDTEDLTPKTLAMYGLESNWATKFSNHRPLVVNYLWQ